jgi:phosphate transport system protein
MDEIVKRLERMHELAANAFIDSIKSFEDLDEDAASDVQEQVEDIEELANKIESSVFETIARRQPVAGDLRALATYSHVAYHLHRVGRYAYKIAYITKLCNGLDHYKELESLPYLAELAKSTLAIAMRGLVEKDLSEIDELEKLEAESDRETADMFEEIAGFLKKMDNIETISMFYVIVGRYCERAADQAFAIAERAYYMVTGERKKLGLAYKKEEQEIGPH